MTADVEATPLVGVWEQITHPLETRDEVGFVEFDGRLWIIGSSVTPVGATGREVFSSSDGINWVSHGPGDWVGQRGPTTVVFDGYIYLIGNAFQDDIYRTNDPASGHWEKVLTDAPWGERHGAIMAVFDDKIWLMGGMRFSPEGWPVGGEPEYDSESFNDIWMSEDGVTWTQVLDHAPWGPRAHINGGAAVLNGKMYIVSGGVITLQPFGTVRDHVGEPYRDVWSTEDGINWTLETDHAPWAGRTFGSLAVFQDQLVLMGGSVGTDHRVMDHDLWFSTDGKTWTQGYFPGLPRHASGMLSFNDDLYITTGLQANDMWRLNGPKRVADQAIAEDSSFSLTLSASDFDEMPADAVFSASLSDGSPLPDWLHFDGSNLLITGTPTNEDVGNLWVVIYADGASSSGAAMFRIVVSNTNDAPLSSDIEINLNPGADYVFSDRAALFSDIDAGDSLGAIRIETLPDAGVLTLGGIAVQIGQIIAAGDMDQLRFSQDAGSLGASSTSFTFTSQDQAGAFANSPSEIRFNIGILVPEALDCSVAIREGQPHIFSIADFGFDDGNAGDSLSGIRIEELPVWGALEFAGVPVLAGQIITAQDVANLRFIPGSGASQSQTSLEFSVIDQTAQVSAESAILIIDVNRLPMAQDVTMHLRQDRIFIPTETDFGFADVDMGDQFAAVRIDSLPDIGQFLLNGSPISVGQIIPAWKIPQIAYIPLGTSHFVHQTEFHFSVQDSRGAFGAEKIFTLDIDTILYKNEYLGDQYEDILIGDDGNNHLIGLGGDDLLISGLGDDILDGGEGSDTVSFAGLTQNIGVSLGTRYGQGTGVGTKWFWDVENLIGGSGNDVFIGNEGDNRLDGGDGNDRLYGEGGDDVLLPGLGDDILDGGSGVDTVSFAGLTQNIGVWLGTRYGQGTGVGTKWFWDVENLIGGSGNDVFVGSEGDNRLEGGDGNDRLYGEGGDDVLLPGLGDDILDGGSGVDTVSFAGLTQNIGVWLGTRYGQGTGVGTKWFWDVENLIGGSGNDVFVGSEGDNRLEGGDGNDRLYGEGGDDVLLPGLGDDLLDGGDGIDTVSFAGLTVDVTATLGASAGGGAAGIKTIVRVENLIGGSGNDRLTGDDGANRLEGGDGDDILAGGLGGDILDGGRGADVFVYSAATQSTSINFDQLVGFDVAEDKIDLPGQVNGFAAESTGTLNMAQFDVDLAAGVNDSLGPNQFGIFTANDGDMIGRIFGVVDVDGDGAYRAGIDYVFEFVAPVTLINQAGFFI